MLAEIIDMKDSEIELKLQDEDISVMYIIQHELLKGKNVEFAGVVLKHPLIKDYLVRVVTKSEMPMQAFQDACASASENLNLLSSLVKDAFKKYSA
ncbi:MAG: RpoL/Rpb11 RNA polymerase subunit family protein [Candidatus Nitrosopolaris sp.]|jgi:DNA-directed RNA polymerase subunit L